MIAEKNLALYASYFKHSPERIITTVVPVALCLGVCHFSIHAMLHRRKAWFRALDSGKQADYTIQVHGDCSCPFVSDNNGNKSPTCLPAM